MTAASSPPMKAMPTAGENQPADVVQGEVELPGQAVLQAARLDDRVQARDRELARRAWSAARQSAESVVGPSLRIGRLVRAARSARETANGALTATRAAASTARLRGRDARRTTATNPIPASTQQMAAGTTR